MLSTQSDEEVQSLLRDPWPQLLTPAGTPNLPAFLEELNGIRARGYSIDNGEVRDGMHCLGAPVFDSGGKQAVAGLAVSLLSHDVNLETQDKVGQAIRRLADKLAERLDASLILKQRR
jgi:DNA-binding IclR family transcriptional regulator